MSFPPRVPSALLVRRMTSHTTLSSSSSLALPLGTVYTARRHHSSGSGSGGGSFFDTLKKKWAEYELHRDRMLDQEAREDAAETRRQRFQPLSDEEGVGVDQSASPAEAALNEAKPIWENPGATPRSVLFVPGDKSRALQKIYTLTADCYILDLEDSVGPGAKRSARENVRLFVDEVATRVSGGECPPIRLVVRINSPERDAVNAMLDLELVGLLGTRIEGVAIPKVSLATYSTIKEYVHPNHQLWAFFETPQAILDAPQICAQSYYQYAVMACNDLAAELRLPGTGPRSRRLPKDGQSSDDDHTISRTDAAMEAVSLVPLWHSTMQVLLSARSQHMQVIGGVFNDPSDRAGFARHLAYDRALGLDGKTLIHPAQIDATNAAWTPSEDEVQWGYRVKEALAKAQGGVATVNGVMVEQLHVRQASRLIARYHSAQLPRRSPAEMEETTIGRVFDEDGEAVSAADPVGQERGTTTQRRRRRGAAPSRHQPAQSS